MKNSVFYALMTAVLFVTLEPVSKLIAADINPYAITFWRFLVGSLMLMPFAIKKIKKDSIKITGKDLGIMLLLGTLCICISMVSLQLAVKIADAPSLIAIIFSSNSIFTILFAILILKEKVTRNKLVALIFGIAGVLFCVDFSVGTNLSSVVLAVLAALSFTVTPCWCYGSETMDMDRNTIKGVWGFNGTERPGAVYLASVLATHAQKGLPAFGIYGHEVQDMDDTSIPSDVKEKLLRFGRAAVAVATMRGKSYLQIGSICMGIGGSIIDSKFMEEYFGMRVESVDEVEVIRRMSEGIYDEAEFQKALKWAKEKRRI